MDFAECKPEPAVKVAPGRHQRLAQESTLARAEERCRCSAAAAGAIQWATSEYRTRGLAAVDRLCFSRLCAPVHGGTRAPSTGAEVTATKKEGPF
jgi:hypothetical protein